MPNYSMNLNALTPPELPQEGAVAAGTFSTYSDGTNNYLAGTTLNAKNWFLLPGTANATTLLTFIFAFANTSAPTTSYLYPGFQLNAASTEYEVVISRGTGEARGALWVQQTVVGGASTTTGPTYVGTSGTTFTGGIKYTVTVTATGTSPRAIVVQVQRQTDSLWLTSAGAWSATQQNALSVSDSSTPLNPVGPVSINTYASAVDAYVYGVTLANYTPQFVQNPTSPVLLKGTSYGGWASDALAAPAQCWDGTRYVMTVSLWSIANAKWASAFFTSPDMQAWTYVPSSLQTPTGSDYIVGNSGLAWFGGKYWWAYGHYPSAGTTLIGLAYSTDLVTWTTVNASLISGGFDPSLSINPGTGDLELWYATGTGARTIYMMSSADGSTWGTATAYLTQPTFAATNFGEPSVFYQGSARYLTFDVAPETTGYRYTYMAHSPDQGTDWLLDGIMNGPYPANAWEKGEVFDASVLVADLGDGYGSVPRMLFAGSDTNSSVDNTDSSIGLARWGLATFAPIYRRSRTFLAR